MEEVVLYALGPRSITNFVAPIVEGFRLDERFGGIKLVFQFVSSLRDLHDGLVSGRHKLSTGGILSFAGLRLAGAPIKIVMTYQRFGTALLVNKSKAPGIAGLEDLVGAEVAAPLAAGNTKSLIMHLKLAGVNVSGIRFVDMPYDRIPEELGSPSSRVSAGVMWGHAASELELKEPGKYLSLVSVPEFSRLWYEKIGSRNHWVLGIAAHESFVKEKPELLQRVHDVLRAAACFIRDYPEEASSYLSSKTGIPGDVLLDSFLKGRFDLVVKSAGSEKNSLMKIFELAASHGLLEKVPDESLIYEGVKPLG